MANVEDLVADESFVRYYNHRTDPQAVSHPDVVYWQQWIAQHPEHQNEITEALQLLTLLHQSDIDSGTLLERQIRLKATLYAALDQQKAVPAQGAEEKKIHPFHFGPVWYRPWAAAVLILFLCTGLLWWYLSPKTVHITTGYGQQLSHQLPDGSLVTMNGNSMLRYAARWNAEDSREVWLEGESFLSVRHQRGKPFRVHLAQSTVEVLGTEFSVRNRKNSLRVVLNSGKISINFGNDTQPLLMRPGDLVQYVPASGKWVKRSVDAGQYAAWKDNRLVFNRTPLTEIAQLIEDTYGLQVHITDDTLKNRQLTGTLPADDLGVLLKGISGVLNLHVRRDKNQLHIGPARVP